MDISIATNSDFQQLRQGIHYRHTDAVQAAAELVALVREFSTRVKSRQDHFHTGYLLLGMQVNGHATSVVCHAERAIGMQHNVNLPTVPGESLIDGIVDHFLRQVVWAGGVGIHTRTLANRLQSSEDFNGVGVIFRHAFSELPINRCGQDLRISFHT